VHEDAKLASAHVAMGGVLLADHDSPGAVREYEEAIRLASDEPMAHFGLARALWSQPESGERIEAALARVTSLSPGFAPAYEMLVARALAAKRADKETIALALKTARLDQETYSWLTLADLLRIAGRADEAASGEERLAKFALWDLGTLYPMVQHFEDL